MEKLSDIFSELFEFLLVFRDMPADERPDYNTFRNKVVVLMDRMEGMAREGQVSSQDFTSAKFALTAFIDELILNSTWEYRKEWKANSLQMQYFQTHTAGEEFFRKLKELDTDQKDVLEVYYFCLCLGFQGEMVSNPAKLMTIRHEIMQRLDFHDKMSSTKLTPQAYETSLHGQKSQWNLPSYLWAILPLGGLLVCYMLYVFILRYQAGSTIEMITG